MNQKTKLILFATGGLLLFSVAVFGVLVARHEPAHEFDTEDDILIEIPIQDHALSLVQNEDPSVQENTPGSAQCTFINKDGTCILSSDIQTDELEDTREPFLDISTLTVTEEKRGTTTFDLELFSKIPFGQPELAYFFLVDADNNPKTGGNPAVLGIPTAFTGTELVATVSVTTIGAEGQKRLTVLPTVWKFKNGSFIKQTSPGIQARIGAMKLTVDSFDGNSNSAIHTNDSVIFEVPNAIRGAVSVPFRMQAVSKQGNKGDFFKESGVEIDWTPATFPLCSVEPSLSVRGGKAIVRATGLVPSHDVVVSFWDADIATGETDTKGEAIIPFIVPNDAQAGNSGINVTSKGTALLASCNMVISQNKIPTSTQGNTEKGCTDSDGGKDYFRQGMANGIVRCFVGGKAADCPGGIAPRTDVCTIGSPQTNGSTAYINEYFCDAKDGRIASDLVPCPNGCAAGACKR